VGTVINGAEPSVSAARELNSKIDHSETCSDDGGWNNRLMIMLNCELWY